MEYSETTTTQLQQIPVFALREIVQSVSDAIEADKMIERFKSALGITPRILESAIKRLTREQLTLLVLECPEITPVKVSELFEQYRYGINPAFQIFLFGENATGVDDINLFRTEFTGVLEAFNSEHGEGLPTIKRVDINDLGPMSTQPDIIEGNYRFLQRLDYIDDGQNAISTYETLYGFFWINMLEKYVIIQAQQSVVRKVLKEAIEASADINLTALVISKQLKNDLPFLSRDTMKSGKLYNPDPDVNNFRSMVISDDKLYAKGYEDLEKRYPVVRQARYRDALGEKTTTLIVQADSGALRIYGRFTASEFRSWCLNRMADIISVLKAYQANITPYVRNLNLKQNPAMLRLRTTKQKNYVIELIIALLTLKQSPNLDTFSLPMTAFTLAAELGQKVKVQLPFQCENPTCEEEAYLMCPTCENRVFTVKKIGSVWQLECSQHHTNKWTTTFPLNISCEAGHEYSLSFDDIAKFIEVVPGKDLLSIISSVIGTSIENNSVDFEQESFFIRGSIFYYHPNKANLCYRTANDFGVSIVGDHNIVTGNNIGNGIAIGERAQASPN
ncbi:MAG: hypothetical protein K8L99_07430 [Anaerolineae bacterium]|nr:hypothetical protein [Anaerolineae bacterium]